MTKIWSKKNAPLIIMVSLGVVVAGVLAYCLVWQNVVSKMYDLNAELQKCESQSDKDICRFRAHWRQIDNYHTTVASPGGMKSFMEIDGDKRRMVTSTQGTYETIIDGNTGYLKANGSWYRMPNACGPQDCADYDPIGISDKLNYKKLGKERCGAFTCFKYEASYNDGKNQAKGTLWFDDKEYKLRRTEADNGDGKTIATYTYGSVHITVPKDYVDAPPPPAQAGSPQVVPSLLSPQTLSTAAS